MKINEMKICLSLKLKDGMDISNMKFNISQIIELYSTA